MSRRHQRQESGRAALPLWLNLLSSGITLAATLLYIALYFTLSEYRQTFAEAVTELPVFTRVLLNIYQSYLSVFVLISVALLVLFFIKSRSVNGRYQVVLLLIVVNGVFAAVVFAVSVVGLKG